MIGMIDSDGYTRAFDAALMSAREPPHNLPLSLIEPTTLQKNRSYDDVTTIWLSGRAFNLLFLAFSISLINDIVVINWLFERAF